MRDTSTRPATDLAFVTPWGPEPEAAPDDDPPGPDARPAEELELVAAAADPGEAPVGDEVPAD